MKYRGLLVEMLVSVVIVHLSYSQKPNQLHSIYIVSTRLQSKIRTTYFEAALNVVCLANIGSTWYDLISVNWLFLDVNFTTLVFLDVIQIKIWNSPWDEHFRKFFLLILS